MKHALRIFAAGAALLAVACTKEQSDGERIPESFPSDSHYVNVDEPVRRWRHARQAWTGDAGRSGTEHHES